jgi:hypothetical protein
MQIRAISGAGPRTYACCGVYASAAGKTADAAAVSALWQRKDFLSFAAS